MASAGLIEADDERGSEQIRYPLLLTLTFARHLPAQLGEFLAEHRAMHAERLRSYREQENAARASGARAVDLITLDFGLRYETAVLDWFDHLPGPEQLRNPAG